MGLLFTVVGASLAAIRFSRPSASGLPTVDFSNEDLKRKYEAPSGLCPWRNPDADTKRFFPKANVHREVFMTMSRHALTLQKRFGRSLSAEDTGVPVHVLLQGDRLLGFVIPRRLKGENGAVEIALALEPSGKVLGWNLQRLREPDAVAQALRSAAFSGRVAGKTVKEAWTLGKDFPNLPAEAQKTGQAILDGAKSALVLYEVGGAGIVTTGDENP